MKILSTEDKKQMKMQRSANVWEDNRCVVSVSGYRRSFDKLYTSSSRNLGSGKKFAKEEGRKIKE